VNRWLRGVEVDGMFNPRPRRAIHGV
jgi:hypothetical protein